MPSPQYVSPQHKHAMHPQLFISRAAGTTLPASTNRKRLAIEKERASDLLAITGNIAKEIMGSRVSRTAYNRIAMFVSFV